MTLQNIGQQIVKYAPTLGKALMFIPGGQIPGAVLSLLGTAFGGTTPEEISTNIQRDPEAEFKLKQLDLQHAENIMSMQNQAAQQQFEADKIAADQELQSQKNRMDWVVTLKWFMFGLMGWVALMVTLIVVASIFEDVVITDREQWLIGEGVALFVAVMSLVAGYRAGK